jgi:type IV secretory pathway VirB3-like protein
MGFSLRLNQLVTNKSQTTLTTYTYQGLTKPIMVVGVGFNYTVVVFPTHLQKKVKLAVVVKKATY